MSHSHSHDHGKCHCEEEMKDSDPEGEDLFSAVDLTGVEAYGEEDDGTVQNVFRIREEAEQVPDEPLMSDDDGQLVIHIPFTSLVKVKSITVIGGEAGSAPKTLKLYTGLESVDFSVLEDNTPVQSIDLVEQASAAYDYPLRLSKF